MNRDELIKKITEKKDFAELPEKDIELALNQFDNSRYLDEEKVKLTRDLLRKVFSAFASHKILSLKDKDPEWILRKHLSTRERLPYYSEIYKKLFEGLDKKKKISVIDLGAGINGFSHNYFEETGFKVSYIGVEAMGQLTNLMNHYFSKNKIDGEAVHLSLFESEKIQELIKKQKGVKIIFLFKVLDSLEMLKRDYSKDLLLDITPLAEKVFVSFATKSMIKRTKFKAKRNWIAGFIEEKFHILEDFELGGERYIVFER
jgi:hypothetical protein